MVILFAVTERLTVRDEPDDVVFLCLRLSGFMIVMYFFETYLDLRQHKAYKKPTLPATLKEVVSEEKFSKARAYSLDKR